MADDDLYGILRELTAIREILERDISSGRENYAAPYNDSFVQHIMSNSGNIKKRDPKSGQYVDTGELDAKSVKTIINDFLKMSDLNTSKSTIFVKKYVDEMKKEYDKYKADSLAQKAYYARSLKKLEDMLVEYSIGAYAKSPMLNVKKGMENPIGAAFLKKIQAEFQVLYKTNSVVSKIAYLFETDLSGKKSRVRKFTEDLIEGLGRSKFVGGALSDMFRLLTYFAATYVKSIPLIGKPLAAILVALGSLGPSLVNGIISGITQALSMILFSRLGGKAGSVIFDKLFGGVGKLFSGGAIAKLFGGLFGGRASGKVASTVGTLVMDGKTLYTSTESLRKAGMLAGTASKVGAGAGIARILGAFGKITPWFGRIFGVVSKFLGPIGWILTGIQLAVLLFKNWDKVMGTIKNGWEKITSGSFWSNIWDSIRDAFTGFGNNGGNNEGATFQEKHPVLAKVGSFFKNTWNDLTGKKEDIPYPIGVASPTVTETHGLLKLDQGGVPLNLQSLNQWNAMTQMEAYRKSNKSLFDSYYEIVPEGLASVQANFKNDLVMRDEDNKNRKGAVLYQGASQDLLAAREAITEVFKQSGMSPSEAAQKASMLAYTSGISTGSSSHSKGGGHSSPLGYGFDLSTGKRWGKKEWDLALPVIKKVYEQRGINAFYEDERGHHFVNPTAENAKFAHIHAETSKSLGAYRNVRNEIWNRYAGIREQNAIALEESKKEYEEAKATQQGIGVTEAPVEQEQIIQEPVMSEQEDRFNQNGYTRIIQPDDSHIKPTFPIQKKSSSPKIDYTGDEMFSDVLRRTIDAAMRDPVQQ